ncbi:hypothetical protein PC41400_20030 [Paenibacillus chitinolyticus]|uniref:Uncharacterized protein n=1 Tax=Paenibacillus chitinolyticus TaxID=79263 RepID=A0A410X043_9BACL|nr:hypothetical protein PC41400_20030 [Paenibacillus chitinolyticus]
MVKRIRQHRVPDHRGSFRRHGVSGVSRVSLGSGASGVSGVSRASGASAANPDCRRIFQGSTAAG